MLRGVNPPDGEIAARPCLRGHLHQHAGRDISSVRVILRFSGREWPAGGGLARALLRLAARHLRFQLCGRLIDPPWAFP